MILNEFCHYKQKNQQYVRVDEFGNTYYTEAAEKFGKKIFDVIRNTKDVFGLDKDYMINTEQIPGESAADKLMKKDKKQTIYPQKLFA